MNVHEANMDIQYISDAYAVIEYVSNYCTKLESGNTALLKNINDTAIADGEAAKDTLKKLSKALDRGREVGIQECIYRILGLPMSKFSEVVKYIDSNHPDRRDGLLKKNIDNLTETESVFHNSIHDYYMNRPKNSPDSDTEWEHMTLADFVAEYTVVQKLPKNPQNETATLLNGKGYIVKRRKPCVIRYFLHYENDEEYYRALCILFLPFRNEKREIHTQVVQELYLKNKSQIEQVRSKYEKHQEIMEAIKKIEQKGQDNKTDDSDSEDEFQPEETTTNTNINDFNQEKTKKAAQKLANSNTIVSLTDDKYLEQINSLNPQQRKIFNDIVERLMDMTDSDLFYLYIGGEAGVGKSYLLKLLTQAAIRIPKRSGDDLTKKRFITIAPTGVAAYLIGGQTIESALSMPIGRDFSL